MINEVTQWTAITVALVFAIGAFRQFGIMTMSSRDYVRTLFGPPVGARIDEVLAALLPPSPELRLPRALVFVRDGCPICEEVLRAVGKFSHVPKTNVTVVFKGDDEYRRTLQLRLEGWHLVDIDGHYHPEEQPQGWPMCILVDEAKRVSAKELGTNAVVVIDHAFREQTELPLAKQ